MHPGKFKTIRESKTRTSEKTLASDTHPANSKYYLTPIIIKAHAKGIFT